MRLGKSGQGQRLLQCVQHTAAVVGFPQGTPQHHAMLESRCASTGAAVFFARMRTLRPRSENSPRIVAFTFAKTISVSSRAAATHTCGSQARAFHALQARRALRGFTMTRGISAPEGRPHYGI